MWFEWIYASSIFIMQLIHVSMFTKKDVMVGITHSGCNHFQLLNLNLAPTTCGRPVVECHESESSTKVLDFSPQIHYRDQQCVSFHFADSTGRVVSC